VFDKAAFSIGRCTEYLRGAQHLAVTVAVGPMRIVEKLDREGNKVFEIIGSCNMWYFCRNEACWFSRESKAVQREERLKSVEPKTETR